MANFIKPCEGRITSPFGWRMHPIRKVRSWHQGVDIAQKGNVPIHAAADGTVIRVGPLGTYGNIVLLRHNIHGKTFETNYAHLRDGSIQVKVGQRVKQGEVIAYMGSTGSSTAQHLHFEVHNGHWATGQPNAVDPEHYMAIPEVVELQSNLNKLGASLEVDGIDGPNTTIAVKEFQKKHDLLVDGNAGPITMDKIQKVLEVNEEANKAPGGIKLTSNQQKAKEVLVKRGYMSQNYEVKNAEMVSFITIIAALINDLESKGVM